MSKVSVHILYNPNNNIYQDNISKQLIKLSESFCAVPSVVRGVSGHVGQSRVAGFLSAKEKYCAYIDDDDFVIDPLHFDRAVEYLENNPDVGAYAVSECKSINGVVREADAFIGDFLLARQVELMHHMQVYRTSIVKQYLNFINRFKHTPELAFHIRLLLDDVKIKVDNRVCYLWDTGANDTHKQCDAELLLPLKEEFFKKFNHQLPY